MKRLSSLIVILTIILNLVAVIAPIAYAEAISIPVAADSYVANGTNATKNYGGDIVVKTLANTAVSREIFLKFNMASFISNSDVVETAKLNFTTTLNGGNASMANQLYQIYRVDNDSWTEGSGGSTGVTASGTDISWNNSRTFTSTLIYTATVRSTNEQVTEIDLTDAIKNELANDATKIITLKLVTTYYHASNNWGLQFYSRESSTATDAMKPQLKVALAAETNSTFVARDKAALSLNYLNVIDGDFSLPKLGSVSGSNISWTSNIPEIEIVENTSDFTAQVTRDVTDIPFILTATISYAGDSDTKSFNGTILAQGTTRAQLDANAISLVYSDDLVNILLPSLGSVAGSQITWASDNTNVITSTGNVIRPEFGNNIIVNLTATVTGIGAETEQKQIPITVKALNYLLPSKDTNMEISTDGTSCSKNYGKETYFMSSKDSRKAIIAFDLSKMPAGVLKKATMYTTRKDTNINYINVNYVPYDAWVEGDKVAATAIGNEISANNYSDFILSQETIAELRTGGSGANVNYNFDITNAVLKDMNSDKVLSLEFEKVSDGIIIPGTSGVSPTSLYSREFQISSYNTDYRPRIVFEMTEDADEILAIQDANAIVIPKVAGSTITLPTAGANGSTISWASSNASIISTEGAVTVQASDIKVALTATITKNGKTITRIYFVKVVNATMPFKISTLELSSSTNNVIVTAQVADGHIKKVKVDKNNGASNAKLLMATYNNDILDQIFVYDLTNQTIGDSELVTLNYKLPSSLTDFRYSMMIIDDFGTLKPLAYKK